LKNALGLGLVGLLLVAAHPRAQSTPPLTPSLASEVKTNFLRMLDRPRVPLDTKTHGVKTVQRGVVSERLDFAVEARPDGSTERVPAVVVRPDWAKPGERLPAVIVLHGTGGRKEAMWPWLEQLAHRGFVAIAIDGRHHGERAGGQKGAKDYLEAITLAWRVKPGEPQPHPFYYDTCWDVWRTIDYLQTRPDVDPDRIGMIGSSKGGIETWLAGAVDDRVKVAVPMIAVQSFRWSLEHDQWQGRANTIREAHVAAAADLGEPEVNRRVCRALWAKVIPGMLYEFDAPSMLRLFAGRPLLILNGEKDQNCPIGGAEVAITAARAAYHDVDADDRLKVMIAKGIGHSITPEQHEAALEWFVAWLKPAPPPSGVSRYLHFKAMAAHRNQGERRKSRNRDGQGNFVGPPRPLSSPTPMLMPTPATPLEPTPAR
jgi:dienelactone hydrolase